MAISPIHVDPQSRFTEYFSFSNITDAFTDSNSTFLVRQDIRLVAVIFNIAVPSYEYPVKLFHVYKATDNVEFVEKLIEIPTSREIRIEFGKGWAFKPCSRLYVECESTSAKDLTIEVTKFKV